MSQTNYLGPGSEMAQWVEALVSESDNLRCILETRMLEAEKGHPFVFEPLSHTAEYPPTPDT